MKKLIFPIIFVIMLSIVNAEIFVSTNSFLNPTQDTFTRSTYVSYPLIEDDKTFTPEILDITLSCEGINSFNSANPTYAVRNSSLITEYIYRNEFLDPAGVFLIVQQNFSKIDYGCTEGSPTCDGSNTPLLERRIRFALKEGEHLTISQVTYFNQSNIIDDSPCSYGLEFTSQNCRGCESLSFEQVTEKLEKKQENFNHVNSVVSLINQIIDVNFALWVYLSYIIKIALIIGVIFGIIYMFFWLYLFIKRL